MSGDLVERLNDEAVRLSGHSIDRGCADSGIASNLADAAADALTEARAEIERLREQVFELEHGVEDQMEEAAYHAKQRAAAESELSTLRARVREVVGPFAAVASDYIDRGLDEDDHVLAGRIVRNNETSSPPRVTFADFRAARQLNEDLK